MKITNNLRPPPSIVDGIPCIHPPGKFVSPIHGMINLYHLERMILLHNSKQFLPKPSLKLTAKAPEFIEFRRIPIGNPPFLGAKSCKFQGGKLSTSNPPLCDPNSLPREDTEASKYFDQGTHDLGYLESLTAGDLEGLSG